MSSFFQQWPGAMMLLAAAAAVVLPPGAGCAEAKEAAGPATRPAGVAVVELFTSEGCSSCPPADAVLAKLAAAARADGRPVYSLAFHVDYWDRLGWKDPFSAKAYTDRQYAYAAARRSDEVYTPQMIVNGTGGFVGSDAAEADRQIAAALGQRPPVGVTITAVRRAGNATAVEYQLSDAPAGAVLNIAVVERGLETKVPRGENAGRTLRHENVVRAFRSVSPGKGEKGTETVALPAGVKGENAGVVVYLQDAKTMRVLGAAVRDLDHP